MSLPRARANPARPIDAVVEPLLKFLHVEAAGGAVLLGATLVAVVLANSPWAQAFESAWKTPLGLSAGAFEFRHSMRHWVNDGLMAVFFFVVGLEVKRELVQGALREVRSAMLPLLAALGGVVVPATIYIALTQGGPGAGGWGIPMATDIAFVVGCMALLGSRLPSGLRVMLLALAIVDDIIAILVIAVGYSAGVEPIALAWAASGLALVALLLRLGVRSRLLYLLVSLGIWYAVHESGVHATLAGVALGLLTPTGGRKGDLHPPIDELIAAAHPWVAFAIMPLFALANAGVALDIDHMGSPLALAVFAGLVLGKPIGIFAASWLAVRLRLAQLPEGVGWAGLAGAGCLAGIGFTMSIFIAALALDPALLDEAKAGVLAASVASAALGMVVLSRVFPRGARSHGEASLPPG